MKIEEKKDSWIFIVPVFGLELTAKVNNEIKISKTTFISTEKLIRVRKRFGIPEPLSKYRKTEFFNGEFKTMAIIRETGKIKDITEKLYKILDDELNILISSFFGYKNRDYFHKIGFFGDSKHSIFNYVFLSSTEMTWLHSRKAENIMPLQTDIWWYNFQKRNHYFYSLVKILNDKQHKLNAILQRVSILIGKSFNSKDTIDAFLYNMIILETLLTTANDKQKDTLIIRLRAFFGWLSGWDNKTEKHIGTLYNKRNAYVHDAKNDSITREDVIFTDELIINLVTNILMHPSNFPSKDALIEFSEKVQAEKLLDIKPKVRPKTFCYIRRSNPKIKHL